jgi:hypothetical protein
VSDDREDTSSAGVYNLPTPHFLSIAARAGLPLVRSESDHVYDANGLNIEYASRQKLDLYHELGHYINVRYCAIACAVYREHAAVAMAAPPPDPLDYEREMGSLIRHTRAKLKKDRDAYVELLERSGMSEELILKINSLRYTDSGVARAVTATLTDPESKLATLTDLESKLASMLRFAPDLSRTREELASDATDYVAANLAAVRDEAIAEYYEFWGDIERFTSAWARVPDRHLLPDYGLEPIKCDSATSTTFEDADAEEYEDSRAFVLMNLLYVVGVSEGEHGTARHADGSTSVPWRGIVGTDAYPAASDWPQYMSLYAPELEVLKRIGLVTETAEGCLVLRTD